MRDEDVPVQAEFAAWDVAVTWLGPLWAQVSSTLTISRRGGGGGGGLVAAVLCAVREWTSLPRRRGGLGCSIEAACTGQGLAWPLANAATLLQYAMGEGAVASPRPDWVGMVLPSAVLAPHNKVVSPGIIPHVGEPHAQHREVLEVVLVPGTTKQALLEGHTLQPLGEGPLLGGVRLGGIRRSRPPRPPSPCPSLDRS